MRKTKCMHGNVQHMGGSKQLVASIDWSVTDHVSAFVSLKSFWEVVCVNCVTCMKRYYCWQNYTTYMMTTTQTIFTHGSAFARVLFYVINV